MFFLNKISVNQLPIGTFICQPHSWTAINLKLHVHGWIFILFKSNSIQSTTFLTLTHKITNVCDRTCRSKISLERHKTCKKWCIYKNRQNVSIFNVHILVRALEIPSIVHVCAEENHELYYIAVDENASLRGLNLRALA